MFVNRKRLSLSFLLVSFLLLGLLAACGDVDTDQSVKSESPSTPVKGGTLKVAFSADPDSIDWMYTAATATRDVGWHIFESLFALDDDYKVRPLIAEDYEVSEDRTLYTITIRPDVNFHNGRNVTVDDVVASIERWRKVSGVGEITNEFIESVKAVDENTIEIKLNKVYNSLLDDFAAPKAALMIIPAEVAEEAGEEPLQPQQLIGTGPFKFDKWDKGNEIILSKFADYSARNETDWGGLTGKKIAYYDEIKFQIVKDPQVAINGVKTGLYDYAQSISPDLFEVIENEQTIESITYIDGYTTITPNKSKSPFDDLKVRQALNHALNKETIAKAVYGNDQFYHLDGALFAPEQTELYSEKGTNDYLAYDPEKAKQLLNESDYNGQTLKVMYANNYADYEKISEIMKQQLEEVGFSVELIPFEWATYLEKWSDPENWDIVVVGWSTRFSPNELGMLGQGSSSSGFYESDRWVSLIQQWGTAEPGEERKEVLGKMNETVWEELPFLKVVNVTTLDIKSNKIEGFESWVGQRHWNTWKSE